MSTTYRPHNTSTDPFENARIKRELRNATPDLGCNVCRGYGIGTVPSSDNNVPCPRCHGYARNTDASLLIGRDGESARDALGMNVR